MKALIVLLMLTISFPVFSQTEFLEIQNLRFKDDNGDNFLQSDENGVICCNIQNVCGNSLTNLKAIISTDLDENITYLPVNNLGYLNSTGGFLFNIPIKANKLKHLKIKFTIKFSANKHDSFEKSIEIKLKSDDYAIKIKNEVEQGINQWQQKGEFEKTNDYKKRVNEETRNKKIEELQKTAINNLKKEYTSNISFDKIELGKYDADNESYLLNSKELGEFTISVPISEAPAFKEKFSLMKFKNPDFILKSNAFILSYVEVSESGTIKKYTYDLRKSVNYSITKIDYKFDDIKVDLDDKSNYDINKKSTNSISVGKSEVDVDIPICKGTKTTIYALIIGNEDYSSFQTGLSNEVNVDYAKNDAKIFKEYCVKTLGIPDKQIKLLINATSGQMNQGIAWLSNLAKVDNGNAELIFYYSGHGLPDEQTKESYLIPVDVCGNNVTQGIKLADVYNKLNENPSKKVSIFLDACFSGGARNQSLVAMKGVKIKPKENMINGNLVVISSSTGEESSGVYRDKQHGYMTYFLLKKIQESKGNISYKELADYIIENVKKETALSGKTQTPQLNYSPAIENIWLNWKIK